MEKRGQQEYRVRCNNMVGEWLEMCAFGGASMSASWTVMFGSLPAQSKYGENIRKWESLQIGFRQNGIEDLFDRFDIIFPLLVCTDIFCLNPISPFVPFYSDFAFIFTSLVYCPHLAWSHIEFWGLIGPMPTYCIVCNAWSRVFEDRCQNSKTENGVTEWFKNYSSQLSLSRSCALGRSFGSNIKHLCKNAAAPVISLSSTALRPCKMSSRVVGTKSLFVWRSVPKWRH